MIQGSCLCGEVAYEIQEPFSFFHYCHCSRCRKASGAAHAANILLEAGQFRWLKGEDRVQRWELPEAKAFCTAFCTTCGSAMPWRTRNGRWMLVPAGSLDADPGARPARSIYWASRAPWFVDVQALPTLDEGR